MEVKKVVVVGMGTMGSQIGIVRAGGGFDTWMVDTSPRQVEMGLKNIQTFLKRQEKKEKEIEKKQMSLFK